VINKGKSKRKAVTPASELIIMDKGEGSSKTHTQSSSSEDFGLASPTADELALMEDV